MSIFPLAKETPKSKALPVLFTTIFLGSKKLLVYSGLLNIFSKQRNMIFLKLEKWIFCEIYVVYCY